MIIGYARVSREEQQDLAAQRDVLRQAGAERLFEEAASGGRWDRPELQRALEHLREGDVFVVVVKLDRLSRSLKDLLTLLERIESAGAGFRSLSEAIDTTTPAGRMMMQMIGSFAEYEREMIRERTRAGLEAARRRGRIGRRRPEVHVDRRTRSTDSAAGRAAHGMPSRCPGRRSGSGAVSPAGASSAGERPPGQLRRCHRASWLAQQSDPALDQRGA
ncbi:recombinase family protein [Halorhodospira sp. 9621]|uniref:recombinase family protein n=1 Tax=Halorhodospira sp. 9621 TaxID=2899135 RepID=UPI001EE7E343|nr:recombinase family protein [Halorhodospira sp. 9621]MCG5534311.1 recombinase family protein [Halorhodospira sp. 9621]